MNRRQKLKKLKRDNELMHEIINNSSEMKEIYRAYNEPIKNVTHIPMILQEYRSRRLLHQDIHDSLFIELNKKELEKEIFESVKENIEFRIDEFCEYPCIEARLCVGRKRE